MTNMCGVVRAAYALPVVLLPSSSVAFGEAPWARIQFAIWSADLYSPWSSFVELIAGQTTSLPPASFCSACMFFDT